MTQAQLVATVEFFLTLGMAWFAYGYLYKRVRNDVFREQLFTIRDDLFDYALARGLSFRDPAYVALRSSLNGMIRSAEQGGFNLSVAIICLRPFTKGVKRPVSSKATQAIAAIQDPEQRAHFEKVSDQIGSLGVRHLWLEGPISFVAGPLVALWLGPWAERRDEVIEVGFELSRRDPDCRAPLVA